MEINDKTGQQRSDAELQESIRYVKEIMVQDPTVPPLLTLHAITILDCLSELQNFRKLLAEARRKSIERS